MHTEPPATPAVRAREAEAEKTSALCTAFDRAISAAIWGDKEEGRPAGLPDSNTAIHDFYDALAAHDDAVAARVTAELLASGTPLWVATDGGPDSDPLFRMSAVFQREPQRLPSGDWHDSGDYGVLLHDVAPLTPPGTVHQAVLLMKPEAGR